MQSRWESLVEAKVNLAVGFGVAWVANVYVAPLLGVRMTGTQGVAMVVMFSVISLIRQYALRRLFNHLHSRREPQKQG
jgi:hypothetical protein